MNFRSGSPKDKVQGGALENNFWALPASAWPQVGGWKDGWRRRVSLLAKWILVDKLLPEGSVDVCGQSEGDFKSKQTNHLSHDEGTVLWRKLKYPVLNYADSSLQVYSVPSTKLMWIQSLLIQGRLKKPGSWGSTQRVSIKDNCQLSLAQTLWTF